MRYEASAELSMHLGSSSLPHRRVRTLLSVQRPDVLLAACMCPHAQTFALVNRPLRFVFSVCIAVGSWFGVAPVASDDGVGRRSGSLPARPCNIIPPVQHQQHDSRQTTCATGRCISVSLRLPAMYCGCNYRHAAAAYSSAAGRPSLVAQHFQVLLL